MVSNLEEGRIVEIKKWGFIDHPGVLVQTGQGWGVIHNSPIAKKVVLSSLEEFAGGYKLHFPTRYQSSLPQFLIEQRARASLGTPWALFYNCQHFISEVVGLKRNSHDLNLFCLMAGIGALSFALRR